MESRSTLKNLGVNEDLSRTLPLPLPQCSSTSWQQPRCPVPTQPETPTSSSQQGPGAGAAPAVPHSTSAFLGLILPSNVKHHSQQKPTPPLPTIKGRLRFQEHWAQLWADEVPVPTETLVLNTISIWICRSTHICYGRNGSLPPILLSTEETSKWEIWFVTLSHQNWTYLGGGWDQKGMYFYSYSFIWQYRSLKCNWI